MAHIQEQGVDLIIVSLDSAFGSKSQADQKGVVAALQRCAMDAGLKGTVVTIWQDYGGAWNFIAPSGFHP